MEKVSHKVHQVWKGPFQVKTSIDDLIYGVEDIVSNEIMETHASKMRYYADSKLNIREDYRLQRMYDGRSWIVDQLLAERFHCGVHEVKIRWKGFTSTEDTWEPVSTISVDCPQLWTDFVSNKKVQSKSKRKQAVDPDDDWKASDNLRKKRKNGRR